MRLSSARPLHILVAAAAAATLSGAALAACGGSSSESPWPVPPENPVLGPEGEEGKPRSVDGAPDAGPDTGPNVEP
jgi:hypothetical protein